MSDGKMAGMWTPINSKGNTVTLRFLSQGPTGLQKRVFAHVEEHSDPLADTFSPPTPQKRRKTDSQQLEKTASPCHSMVTRGKSRDAAGKAVFNTHELALMILYQLPMQKLLQVRRVCKSFHSLISHDPHLQRQLFLLPEPQSTIWVYDTNLVSVRAYSHNSAATMETSWLKRHRKTVPGKVNPLLFTKDEKHEHVPGVKNNVFTMMKWCDTVRFLRRPSLRPSITATSLVHSMYICQPPCTEAEFKWFFFAGKPRYTPGKGTPGWKCLRIRVWNENGVRFGDLVRGFVEEARKGNVFEGINPEEFYLRRAPSVVWMKGICFPNEEQRDEVKCGMWDVYDFSRGSGAAV